MYNILTLRLKYLSMKIMMAQFSLNRLAKKRKKKYKWIN